MATNGEAQRGEANVSGDATRNEDFARRWPARMTRRAGAAGRGVGLRLHGRVHVRVQAA